LGVALKKPQLHPVREKVDLVLLVKILLKLTKGMKLIFHKLQVPVVTAKIESKC